MSYECLKDENLSYHPFRKKTSKVRDVSSTGLHTYDLVLRRTSVKRHRCRKKKIGPKFRTKLMRRGKLNTWQYSKLNNNTNNLHLKKDHGESPWRSGRLSVLDPEKQNEHWCTPGGCASPRQTPVRVRSEAREPKSPGRKLERQRLGVPMVGLTQSIWLSSFV